MPSKTVEVVLITLILFLIYSFSINFFQEITLKSNLDEDIAKYAHNNLLLCLTVVNLSYGSLRCVLSFEYSNLEFVSGKDIFYVKYNNKHHSSNIPLSTIFNKKVYGIGKEQIYLKNDIENITIS